MMTHDEKLREVLEEYKVRGTHHTITQAIADINALDELVDVDDALNILDRNVVNCVVARADVSMRGDSRLIFGDRLPLTEEERVELWETLANRPLYARRDTPGETRHE